MSKPLAGPFTPPTKVRHTVVLVTALMSVLLYLDRYCISFAEGFIKEDLHLSATQVGWMLGGFFWTYALLQVPSGWLTDRFGARLMLTGYILVWSLFTGLTGAALGFAMLLLFRFGMGVGQAGAYPTGAAVVGIWVPVRSRGAASSIVAVGGRIGGFLALLVTGPIIVMLVPTTVSSRLAPGDLLDVPRLGQRLTEMAGTSSVEKAGNEEDPELPAALAQGLLDRLSPESRQQLEQLGKLYADRETLIEEQKKQKTNTPQPPPIEVPPAVVDRLADELNAAIADRELFPSSEIGQTSALYIALEREGKTLLARRRSQLNQDEVERLNRLVLEGAFPGAIRKVYGAGWRPLMWIYGSLGLLVAALYWFLTRDRPEQHPRINRAEIDAIDAGRPASSKAGAVRGVPMIPLLTSFSMWLCCVSQFFTNIGWVFIVTWAPRYFQSVHHVPVESRGLMVSIPTAVGFIGMLGGGWLTDYMVRRVGLRWGRALPLGLSRFMAMGAYIFCLTNPSPWAAVAAFSLVAISTDLGTPSTWAFNQDVGGQYVGSVLGWGNMFGNLGAALAPVLMAWVVDIDGAQNWNMAFITCGGAFLISGLTGLGINATVPLIRDNGDGDTQKRPGDDRFAADFSERD